MTDHPICPRCNREAHGWPVYRGGDRCSPRDWVNCIREPFFVLEAIARKDNR